MANWILIFVIISGVTQTATILTGFTEEGCKAAAKEIDRTQRAYVTCVEKK